MEDRLLSTTARREDEDTETSLRPHTLRDYVGQESVRRSLQVYISAALKRHDALDHILLYCPPVLGKTTLACILAA